MSTYTQNIPNSGGTFVIASYKKSCMTNATLVRSTTNIPSFTTATTVSDSTSSITVSVGSNPSYTELTDTATLSYGNSCSHTFNFIQAAGASCDGVEFYDMNPSVSSASAASIPIAHVNSAFTLSIESQPSWTNNITSQIVESYGGCKMYFCSVEANPTSEQRTGTFTYKTEGCSETFISHVTQEASDVHTYEFSASTQAQEGENKDKITVQSSGEGGGGVIVWSKRDGEDIPFTVVTSKPSEIWTYEIQAPNSMHPYHYLWQYATKDASVGITITFTQNGSGNIITATTRHNYNPDPGPGPSPSSDESVEVTIHNNVNGAAINTVGIMGRNTCGEDGWTSDVGFSVGGGAISYGGSKTNTVILPSDWSTINYYMLRGTYNGGSTYSAINTSCGGHTFSLSVTRNASSKTMDIYLIGNA